MAFIGGFLALMGGLADRDGLVWAGGITAGIGVIAIAPGVYLIVGSGSKAEVRSDGAPVESSQASPSPELRLGAAF
jgi:hypothetical protein